VGETACTPSPGLPNQRNSEYIYAQTVDQHHSEPTSNSTVHIHYNVQRHRPKNKSTNNKTYDTQSKITVEKAKVGAEEKVSDDEEDEDEDYFAMSDAETRQIEQGKGPESEADTLPTVLMKTKLTTNNPKWFKGAIKLYTNVLPPSRYAISCKVMNEPRARNARAPNEAIYLNVIILCQPLLSQKGVLAWKLYHNRNANNMMPMLTFDWNILSFTVVYDSQENCKTAYKKVTAYQGSKGSQIHEVTMRDHNGDEVFHPHQRRASPLTIKYHYPVIEMAVTDSNTPPTNTHDNLSLYTCALQFQVLVPTHLNKLILTTTPICAHTTPHAHKHTRARTHRVLRVRTESASTYMFKSTSRRYHHAPPRLRPLEMHRLH